MRRLAGATTSGVLRIRRREELYRELLTRFFVLLKAVQCGESDEADRSRALSDFHVRLSEILDHESTLFLSERDGYLYVNAIRARIDADAFAMQRFLVREFAQNGIAGVIFERGLTEAEIPLTLDALFHAGSAGAEPAMDRLRAIGVKKVHVLVRTEDGSGIVAAAQHGNDRLSAPGNSDPERTYFKSILVLRHFLRGLDGTCPVGSDERHRIAKAMSQRMLVHEDGHVALDLVREFDQAALASVLRVAVPAVAVATRYGFSDGLARDFGIATLLAGVLCAVDDADRADPFERQQVLHLVANGGASGLLLLSALCGWDDHDVRDGDPSVATSILRATRSWLDDRREGTTIENSLEALSARGFESDVVHALLVALGDPQ
ncbi:MAG: hypothetical protein H6832_18315 [Planctomycetes bacterium]|nr:hypothetical protein [Planctomycetota bacterium]MCB9920362.1 hypothetical protein [Planctomycetota bacterium]